MLAGMSSPRFRYSVDFILVIESTSPVACGHMCYKTHIPRHAPCYSLIFKPARPKGPRLKLVLRMRCGRISDRLRMAMLIVRAVRDLADVDH